MKYRTFQLPARLGIFLALTVSFAVPSEIAAQVPPDVIVTQGTTVIPEGGSFDYGDTNAGFSTPVTFTLHNYGVIPLTLTNVPRVTIGGANPADFLLLQDLPGFIPPGSPTPFEIAFVPVGTGVMSATVTIEYVNTSPDSYEFLIQGTGIFGPIDSDGDGVIDDVDNCPFTYNPDQADLDGDGIGDTCDPDADGDGYEAAGGDCDDTDAGIHPGAEEICGDGIDQDCDGSDLPCVIDSDGDGIPDDQDNCPDTVNPDQADLDGDGIGDTCDPDADGDGYEVGDGDCDDTDAGIHPGAEEICGDGIDQDCDGYDPPCSEPVEAILELISDIRSLEGVPRGLTNSLIVKLEAAIRSLESGRSYIATNQLGAFINQLQAQRGKNIADGLAGEFILRAEAVIDSLLVS